MEVYHTVSYLFRINKLFVGNNNKQKEDSHKTPNTILK